MEFADFISLVLLNMPYISCELIIRCRSLIILDLSFWQEEQGEVTLLDGVLYFLRRYAVWLHHFWKYYQLPMIISSLSIAKYDILDMTYLVPSHVGEDHSHLK